VELVKHASSSVSLVERMIGYDKVIIIDCFKGDDGKNLYILDGYKIFSENKTPLNLHDINVGSIFYLFKEQIPDMLPKKIKIIGIKCENIELSEHISDQTMKSVLKAVDLIIKELKGENEE